MALGKSGTKPQDLHAVSETETLDVSTNKTKTSSVNTSSLATKQPSKRGKNGVRNFFSYFLPTINLADITVKPQFKELIGWRVYSLNLINRLFCKEASSVDQHIWWTVFC